MEKLALRARSGLSGHRQGREPRLVARPELSRPGGLPQLSKIRMLQIWILTSPTHVKPSGCAVTSAVIGFMQLVAMPSKDWPMELQGDFSTKNAPGRSSTND
ncbi:hypothetical protein Q1695_011825 [Nippostrongylus brasiliensis]|nr:hypothetical protein Q1695_011825 [Nippostrongylus brasiliensis]